MFKIYSTLIIRRDLLTGLFGDHQIDLVINDESSLSREKFLLCVNGANALLIDSPDIIDKEALDAAGPSLKVIIFK
jgi:hypothetical protein